MGVRGLFLLMCVALPLCLLPASPADGWETRVVVAADGNSAELRLIVYFEDPPTDAQLTKWKEIFAQVSDLLNDATEGALRLGTTTFTTNSALRRRADIVVSSILEQKSIAAVSAHDGWSRENDYIILIKEQHICDGLDLADAKEIEPRAKCRVEHFAPFGIVHELGHYLFGLGDEYRGRLFRNCATGMVDARGCACQLTTRLEVAEGPKRVVVIPPLPDPSKVDDGVRRGFDCTPADEAVRPRDDLAQLHGSHVFCVDVDSDVATFDFLLSTSGAQVLAVADPEEDPMRVQLIPPGGGEAIEPSATLQTPIETRGRATSISYTWAPEQRRYTLQRPTQGTWQVRVINTGAVDATVTLEVEANAGCQFRCSEINIKEGGCGGREGAKACMMDGGTTTEVRNLRREFCTAYGESGFDGATTHYRGVHVRNPGCGGEMLAEVTEQEAIHACSCWDTIQGSPFRLRFFGALEKASTALRAPSTTKTQPSLLPPPLTRPTGLTAPGGLGRAIDESLFELLTGPAAYILAIDASTSMDEKDADPNLSKLQLALRGAQDAVNLLANEELLGVWSFSGTTVRRRGLAPAGEDRTALLASLSDGSITTGARTAMGQVLRDALADFTAYEAQTLPDGSPQLLLARKSIVLLSDGRNNLGADPIEALKDILRAGRTTVYTIALGDGADTKGLAFIAEQSGGEFFFARDSADLRRLLPLVFAAARGEEEIYAHSFANPSMGPDERLPAGSEQTVPASGSDERIQLGGLTKVATFIVTSDVPSNQLAVTLRDGDGTPYTSASDGVLYRAHEYQQIFKVPAPKTGRWTVSVRNGSNAAASWTLQVVVGSEQLSIATRIIGGGQVTFPAPLHIESIVRAVRPVTGLGVTARVFRPGTAAFAPIKLFDDGLAIHGDSRAEDGIYSALFADYLGKDESGGDGIHLVRVTAVNPGPDPATPGGTRFGRWVAADDGLAGQPTNPVDTPFILEDETCAIVGGIPGITKKTGTALLEPVGVSIGKSVPAAQVSATPIVRFQVSARDEALLLRRVTVQLDATADATPIPMVGLYLDLDRDGVIDNAFEPVRWTTFQAVAGEPDHYTATFETDAAGDPFWAIPVGEPFPFLVTLGQPVPPPLRFAPAKASSPQPGDGALPPLGLWGVLSLLTGLVLLGALRLGGRVAAQRACAFCLIATCFLGTHLMGCGGSTVIEDPGFPGGGTETEVQNVLPGAYKATIAPSDLLFEPLRNAEGGLPKSDVWVTGTAVEGRLTITE